MFCRALGRGLCFAAPLREGYVLPCLRASTAVADVRRWCVAAVRRRGHHLPATLQQEIFTRERYTFFIIFVSVIAECLLIQRHFQVKCDKLIFKLKLQV